MTFLFQNVRVIATFDESYFEVYTSSVNGTYHTVKTLQRGYTTIHGHLKAVIIAVCTALIILVCETPLNIRNMKQKSTKCKYEVIFSPPFYLPYAWALFHCECAFIEFIFFVVRDTVCSDRNIMIWNFVSFIRMARNIPLLQLSRIVKTWRSTTLSRSCLKCSYFRGTPPGEPTTTTV